MLRTPVDKTTLGDYIGEADEFNKRVMHAMVDSTDMTNCTLDQALRRSPRGGVSGVLWRFR